MQVLGILCAAAAIHADEAVPQQPSSPDWQLLVFSGFHSVAAQADSPLAKNRGAELGTFVVTPWRLFQEKYTAVVLRVQTIAFPRGITIPSPAVPDESIKLTNATHTQLRTDFRHILTWLEIDWSLGGGLMLPVTSSILTPRGEFDFANAKQLYPLATSSLQQMDSSYALFFHAGIDQMLLAGMLLLGVGVDISLLEFPRTKQSFAFSLYAGVRVW